MSVLRIPQEHQAGLAKLAQLSEQEFTQLRAALASAAHKKDIGSISAEDVAPVMGLPRGDLQKIIEAIVGLNYARVYSDSNIDDFARDVSSSMQTSTSFDFSMKADAVNQFRKRVEAFLSIDEISQSAKADALRYEHERSVHSLRILTDVRPIFGSSVEEAPEAIVITHTLKIAFHRAGRLDEVFFAMDEIDLQSLKEAVARAELKAKSIRAALAKSSLKVIAQE